MTRNVVITAATALDHSAPQLPDKPGYAQIRMLAEAVVHDQCPISERLKRKTDGFCHKGMTVAATALAESRLLESDPDPARTGIFVGNCLGGWGRIENEVLALHRDGVAAMGPYVATAWFPAALQGQISLHYGFRGHSKTFSAFGVAGVQAFIYAAQAIMLDLADTILCCASEDLSSPYVRTVLERTVARGWPESKAYGENRASGGAEGAAAFVLEERNSAQARGAPILCEIVGSHDGFVATADRVGPMLALMLPKLVRSKGDPLLYVLDGRFSREREETSRMLGRQSIDARMIDVSALIGEQFAVGGLTETVIAARGLKDGRLTASAFGELGDRPFRQAVIQRLSSNGNLAAIGLRATANLPLSAIPPRQEPAT